MGCVFLLEGLIEGLWAASEITVVAAIAVEGGNYVSDYILLVIVASLSPVAAITRVGLELWAASRVEDVSDDLILVDLRRNNFGIIKI